MALGGLGRENRGIARVGGGGKWPSEKLTGLATLGTHTPIRHQPGRQLGRAVPGGDRDSSALEAGVGEEILGASKRRGDNTQRAAVTQN